MRRGEALGLRWSDLDFISGRASVVQTVKKIGGRVQVGPTKTSAGRRSVALDRDLVAVLEAHREVQDAERQMTGAGWTDTGLVFTGPTGGPQYPESVSRALLEQAAAAGLPRIRLQDLRHTWATLALQAGVHPKVVQERLGNANVSITLGTYSHVSPTLHGDAAETVAALLRGEAVDRR